MATKYYTVTLTEKQMHMVLGAENDAKSSIVQEGFTRKDKMMVLDAIMNAKRVWSWNQRVTFKEGEE